MNGEMTEMAISGYLGWLILLMATYPLLLAGISMFFYHDTRKHAIRWFNVTCFLLVTLLLYAHMQTEIVYGQELLEVWYRDNPEDRPQ